MKQPYDLKEGDTVFVAWNTHSGTAANATVSKVGRDWVYIGGGRYRFPRGAQWPAKLDGGQFSPPGSVYPDEAAYNDEKARGKAYMQIKHNMGLCRLLASRWPTFSRPRSCWASTCNNQGKDMDDLLNKQHPAPWRVVEPDAWPWHITIVDANGGYVLLLKMPHHSPSDETLADVLACRGRHEDSRLQAIEANAAQMQKARRIVAEHNALHAVPLEWLDKYEQAGIEPALAELVQVKQQRDELLAALKLAVSEAVADSFDDWYANAQSVIASVEGGSNG